MKRMNGLVLHGWVWPLLQPAAGRVCARPHSPAASRPVSSSEANADAASAGRLSRQPAVPPSASSGPPTSPAAESIASCIDPAVHPRLYAWTHEHWPHLVAVANRHASGENNLPPSLTWAEIEAHHAALVHALDEVSCCFNVLHIDKLKRRVQRDGRGHAALLCAAVSAPSQQSGLHSDANGREPSSQPRPEPVVHDDSASLQARLAARLQGAGNNLLGFAAELHAVVTLPNVVAVGRVVRGAQTCGPTPRADESGIESGAESVTGVASARDRKAAAVEVDVVSHGGLAWVEVKGYSGQLTLHEWERRADSSQRGLKEQLATYVSAAADARNHVAWQRPAVFANFPLARALSSHVREEIEQLGCLVIVGACPPPPLPPPPRPAAANFDATALCALVSQVSNDDGPRRPELEEWSRANAHWTSCYEQELRDPVVPALMHVVGAMDWVASGRVVELFETLMARFAGPCERQRWHALRDRLRVHEPDDARSDLIQSMANLTAAEAEMLGLSDAKRAVTVTANARLASRVRAQSTCPVFVVHHAIWLTGL